VKSNKPYKSLKDVYSESVNGHVAPRRHLRVLGESELWGVDDKEEARKEWEAKWEKCKAADDPKECMETLMRGINVSSLIGIFKEFLTSEEKAWNKQATANYAKELAALMMPHAGRGSKKVEQLEEFLSKENRDKHPNFPTKSRKGNLITDFGTVEGFNVDEDVVKSLMSHSGVDERKRGVGMAELGMSLLFKNIGSAIKAGDLEVLELGEPDEDGDGTPNTGVRAAIGREGFEIKGHNAILGTQPEKHKIKWPLLKKFGIVDSSVKDHFAVEGAGAGGADELYPMGQFAEALADIYTSIENETLCLDEIKTGDEFIKEFKKLLFETAGNQRFESEGGDKDMRAQYDKIRFNDPVSINSGIGLINFIMYAAKEGFTHFLAHDFGAKGKSKTGTGNPQNNGDYLYVTGKPGEMADLLLNSKSAYFEPIKPTNIRPRISAMAPVGRPYYKKELEADCTLDPEGRKPGPGGTLIAPEKENGHEPRRLGWTGEDYAQAEEEELARHIDELSR